MDQVKQQVTITKASQQTFGTEDWQLLQKQLAAWKASSHSFETPSQSFVVSMQHSEDLRVPSPDQIYQVILWARCPTVKG